MVRKTSTSAPSARATTASTWPGPDRSSMEASTRPGWAAPVWPTVSPDRRPAPRRRTPSLRARALTARPCMPVTATWSTWSALSPAVFRADSHASAPSGTYRVSPNRSSQTLERRSPAVRHRSRNSSLTEAPPRYSAITGVPGASSPTRTAAAPSPPADSSADVGRPSRRSARTTSVVPGAGGGQARPQGAGPRPEGAAEVEGGHVGGLAQGGVDGGGVGLVQVGRAWPWRTRWRPAPPPGPTAGPGGPPPPPWWWCPRRGRPPTGCPCRPRCRTPRPRRTAAGADRGHTRRC